jgi:hypothetical protein
MKMVLQGRLLRWAAASLAVLGLILVVANAVFNGFNQRLQDEVAARQQAISNRVEVQRIGEALVRSIVAAEGATKDTQLLALMTKHGLPTPGSAPAPAAAGRTK